MNRFVIKCSNNKKGYKGDLTSSFRHFGIYEIDLVDRKSDHENINRRRQVDEVNELFDARGNHAVLMFIEGKKGTFYRGVMKSKFQKNTTDPFYQKQEVLEKARSVEDISDHPFYTCDVEWEQECINTAEVDEFKSRWSGKFLGKTLVVL